MKRNLPVPFVPMVSPSWDPDPSDRLHHDERVVLGVFLAEWQQGHDIIAMSAKLLAYRADLPKTSSGRALARLVERGHLVVVSAGAPGRGRTASYRVSEKVTGGPFTSARPGLKRSRVDLSSTEKRSNEGVYLDHSEKENPTAVAVAPASACGVDAKRMVVEF